MKKFILGVAGVLFVSLLFFQCTKEKELSDLEGLELLEINEIDDYALAGCKIGPAVKKTLNLANLVPSTLNGKTAAELLAAINWGVPPDGTDLCAGECKPTGTCKPTKIVASQESHLKFVLDAKGKVKNAKWKNSTVDAAAAKVSLKAKKCECL